jgi:hypothetical protein
MNSTAISSASSTRRPRRLARLVSALLTIVVTFLGVTLSATPAHAATSVTGCFRSAGSGLSIEGVNVYLQAYTNQGWVNIWSSTLPRSQCVSVNTSYYSGYYLRYVVDQSRFGARWFGVSPYNATPGRGAVHVGTGTVNCIGCWAS